MVKNTTAMAIKKVVSDVGEELIPTSLWLPVEHENDVPERLYLPRHHHHGGQHHRQRRKRGPKRNHSKMIDEYLLTVPKVASRVKRLSMLVAEPTMHSDDDEAALQQEENPKNNKTSSSPLSSSSRPSFSLRGALSCLTVLQGEVAHASSLQTDLVVSAEATTCHVVALRSTTTSSNSSDKAIKSASTSVPPPFVSLAHVDHPDAYEDCMKRMVAQHLEHHNYSKNDSNRNISNNNNKQSATNNNASASSGLFWDEDGGSPYEEEESFGMGLNLDDSSSSSSDNDNPIATTRTSLQQSQKTLPSSDDLFLPNPISHSNNSKKKKELQETKARPIEMELHIVGGYLDKNGTSQSLSSSLIRTFSNLAETHRDKIRISLSTAAISTLNTMEDPQSGHKRPVCRGLGIDTRTGEVFGVPDKLPAEWEAPALEVRSARIFCPRRCKSLSVIHDASSNAGEIRVEPFSYRPIPSLNSLLHAPDEVLLHATSTSPECESDRFCSDLKRTLSFVNTVPPEQVFGNEQKKPLIYSRSASNLNEWEAAAAVVSAAAFEQPPNKKVQI